MKKIGFADTCFAKYAQFTVEVLLYKVRSFKKRILISVIQFDVYDFAAF